MLDRTPRGSNARESSATAATKRPCEESTKQGTPCRAFALPGERFCWGHHPDRQGDVRRARQKGGKVAGQLRSIEGRRKKLDSASDLIRFTAGVVQDVLSGAVGPDVARACLYGISIQRQLIEASDIERRLAALEQQRLPAYPHQQQGGRPWRQ